MQIAYATGCNWTVQLGALRLESTTEQLLPGEVAPMFERSAYTIPPSGYYPGRYTCFKFAAFGRRVIVELVRPVR